MVGRAGQAGNEKADVTGILGVTVCLYSPSHRVTTLGLHRKRGNNRLLR